MKIRSQMYKFFLPFFAGAAIVLVAIALSANTSAQKREVATGSASSISAAPPPKQVDQKKPARTAVPPPRPRTKGAPLPTKSELTALEKAAKNGDLNAAKQMVEYSENCSRIANTTALATPFLGQNIEKMTPKQKEEYEATLDSIHAVLRDYGDFCKENGDYLVSAQMENFRIAGDLGDVHSANCFVSEATDMSFRTRDPELIRFYQDEARSFVEKGFQRGDWAAVSLMFHAYAVLRIGYKGQVQSALLAKFDPPEEYKYAKLLSMGVSDDPIVPDRELQAYTTELTPEQIAAGTAQLFILKRVVLRCSDWYRISYRRTWNYKRRWQPDLHLCRRVRWNKRSLSHRLSGLHGDSTVPRDFKPRGRFGLEHRPRNLALAQSFQLGSTARR